MVRRVAASEILAHRLRRRGARPGLSSLSTRSMRETMSIAEAGALRRCSAAPCAAASSASVRHLKLNYTVSAVGKPRWIEVTRSKGLGMARHVAGLRRLIARTAHSLLLKSLQICNIISEIRAARDARRRRSATGGYDNERAPRPVAAGERRHQDGRSTGRHQILPDQDRAGACSRRRLDRRARGRVPLHPRPVRLREDDAALVDGRAAST